MFYITPAGRLLTYFLVDCFFLTLFFSKQILLDKNTDTSTYSLSKLHEETKFMIIDVSYRMTFMSTLCSCGLLNDQWILPINY